MARKKPEPPTLVTLETGEVVAVGNLIAYYRNGWRYGYLESISTNSVEVRPVSPPNARMVTVPTEDLKAAI